MKRLPRRARRRTGEGGEVTTPSERALVWSYGGGVQSAAIAVLVVQGRLPRPERIVMADTGREATLTWDYLRNYIQPYLATVGLTVEIAPHSLASVDLFSESGDRRPMIPLYNSGGGRLPNFCSTEWKRRVVSRWCRAEGYPPSKRVEWLGISTDEIHRAHPGPGVVYPLLDLVPMPRVACSLLVISAGLPQPPRSSCWMCPFRSPGEWRSLKERGDGDWERAVALDRELRTFDVYEQTHYLHRSMKPLDEVDLGDDSQGVLFDVCEEGRCEF